ncbi:hypothetical protein Tco_0328991 [Tanacetum coccineum]
MESRNASFFEHIFPCLSKETGSSARLDNKVVQDKRKQDDNDLPDERQDQIEEKEVEPRRSKKARNEKSFGPDFVSFMVENEPTSYREAELVDLPPGCKPLGYKWIFNKKMKADGTIDKYKARSKFDIKYMVLADVNLEQRSYELRTGAEIKSSTYVVTKFLSTRPDLAYAVSRLSRYTSNPSYAHWTAITRVLHYLRYNHDYGLHYDRHPVVIEGYSDENWISDIKDSRSTSGYVFTLGGAAISWKYSKQTVIAKSTMES